MLIHIITFIIGLTAIYFGAEWLVRGSSRLAKSLNIRPIIIGLTIVAFGGSAPEAAVSIVAAFKGNSDIALGNILGSVIANIGLVFRKNVSFQFSNHANWISHANGYTLYRLVSYIYWCCEGKCCIVSDSVAN